jgi:hypothetical protein
MRTVFGGSHIFFRSDDHLYAKDVTQRISKEGLLEIANGLDGSLWLHV